MFDEENEKRNKTLVYIVLGIIGLIVLIVLLSSLGNKNKKTEESNPSCLIKFARQADRGNVYTRPVEVSIEATPSKGNTIVNKNVGMIENSGKNGEKYTITTNGEVVVKGYAKDSSGKVAKCEEKVMFDMPMPTCTLKVVGDESNKIWYNEKIEIAFDEVKSNNDEPIAKEEFTVSLVKGGSKTVKEGNAILETNGEYVVKGTVTNSDGNTGTCTLEVKLDTEPPVCTLKKIKEEISDSKKLNVLIGFDTVTDDLSEVENKGVGLEENYSAVDYTINKRGVFTINGYVKDKAGNKGTCSIVVDTKSNTSPLSAPSCQLTIDGTKSYDGSSYCTSATIKFASKTSTNDANIVEYGIGTVQDYENYNKTGNTFLNGKDKLTVTSNDAGTQTTYVGMVMDSNGEVATCSVNTKVIAKCEDQTPVCSLTQTNSVLSDGGKISEATIGFDMSGTYAKGNNSIVKYGLNTSNNNNLNGKKEIVLNKEGSYSVYGIVEDSSGNIGKCGPYNVVITGVRYPYLAAVAKPGDIVNYDAGKWTQTASIPTTQGKVGGYTSGNSRGTGVSCTNPRNTTKDGWIVLSNSNGVVTITTKGTPECYFHAIGGNANSSISVINGEASKYVNSEYATSAKMMTYTEASAILNKANSGSDSERYIDMLITGDYYYLATKGNSNYTIKSVRYAFTDLEEITDRAGYAQGIRPIVTLKSEVVTTGTSNNGYNIDIVK